ncbi:MAG: hypothetical protein AB8H86_05945 [Polyangiales bacterium]
MREALAEGDFDTVIAGLDSLPWANAMTLRERMLIEWFIREAPAFAHALWVKGQVFTRSFHLWIPVLTELIEHGDLDPNLAIDQAQWFGGVSRTEVPFAIVQMLLRSGRRDEAVEVGTRWLRDPLEVQALLVATTTGDEQRRALDAMEAAVGDQSNIGESITFETCRALCDHELPLSLWGGRHSSLNSTLIQEVPRRTNARSSRTLFLVRAINEECVFWVFVAACSPQQAAEVAAARLGLKVEVDATKALYEVEPGRSRLCIPAHASVGIVSRNISGIGERDALDYTGLSDVRNFHDALDPKREITMRRAHERDLTWPGDLAWPKPRLGAWLPAPYNAALATGLFK